MNAELMALNGLSIDDFKEKNNDKLYKLMDLITIEKTTSDKLGFDWEVIKLGDIEVRKTYVANPTAKGTKENPFTDDSIKIDNAYYIIDGEKFVCMGGTLVSFDW